MVEVAMRLSSLYMCGLLLGVVVCAESIPTSSTVDTTDAEVVNLNGQDANSGGQRTHKKHNFGGKASTKASSVSFSYDHTQKASDMGEATKKTGTIAPQASGAAAKMVQMGTLLDGFNQRSDAGEAIASLTSALQAKLLMDKLKPDGIGSFVQQQSQKQQGLGEESEDKNNDISEDGDQQTFNRLMHTKKKNMAAITAYLMSRKAEGKPLSSNEDHQLQKFYYNRASTILKKIVLLRKGETAPEFESEHDNDTQKPPTDKLVSPEVDEDAEETADETEKLKYDATVADDNTAYDNKEAQKLERQEEAEDAERMAEDREEMDKLEFDRKIAKANEKYNDELLAQVKKEAHKAQRVSMVAKRAAEALRQGLKKQDHMSKVEDELAKQKERAQKAVTRFTSEQENAEQKVEAAEKAKEEADSEAAKAAAMLADAEKSYVTNNESGGSSSHKKKIPLPHFSAAERMHNMVQYLQTALSHHNKLSQKDLNIMQAFFLEHGGQMLSKIAQIEPDATWNDKGVMGTEQWAMDHSRPDQLSEEWGGKRVRKDTIVRDVVKHELDKRESNWQLKRPNQQAIQGLFGASSKLDLKFAPDDSQKIDEEPELGDSMDDEVEQLPNQYAYASMMGIN